MGTVDKMRMTHLGQVLSARVQNLVAVRRSCLKNGHTDRHTQTRKGRCSFIVDVQEGCVQDFRSSD